MEHSAGDIMVTWFTSNAYLVMSCWAWSCTHMHGTCAIIEMGAYTYSNGLMGMPAGSNLMKLTTYFNALIAQNANKNMLDMFPVAYLNENLTYCNENLACGK